MLMARQDHRYAYIRKEINTKAFQDKSRELIRLLSHHLLFVGQQCVMATDSQTERALVGNSHLLWHKSARWSWSEVPKDEQSSCQGKEPFAVSHKFRS